jgi:hypothetical protein
MTRSYTDKRGIARALNAGETKVFARLEADSLQAEGGALNDFTSMPSQCRGRG